MTERIPRGAHPLLLLLCAGLLVLAGWAVGELVAGPLDSTSAGFDREVVQSAQDLRESWLTDLMEKATFFGSTVWLLLALTGAVLVAVIGMRSPRWAAFFVGCMAGGFISTVVKRLVDRPRPSFDPLHELLNAAFPSGHALTSAIAFGALGFFLVRGRGLDPKVVWPSAVACAFLVGLTRIYLGVHWPTDVLGGWALGAGWVAAVALIVRPGVSTDSTDSRGQDHSSGPGGPRSSTSPAGP